MANFLISAALVCLMWAGHTSGIDALGQVALVLLWVITCLMVIGFAADDGQRRKSRPIRFFVMLAIDCTVALLAVVWLHAVWGPAFYIAICFMAQVSVNTARPVERRRAGQ